MVFNTVHWKLNSPNPLNIFMQKLITRNLLYLSSELNPFTLFVHA